MKKLLSLFALVAIFTSTITSHAAVAPIPPLPPGATNAPFNPPNSLPISSVAQLRQYAWGQVSNDWASVWAHTMTQSPSNYYYAGFDGHLDPDEAMSFVNTQRFSFAFLGYNIKAGAYVTFYNNQQTLFSGNLETTMVWDPAAQAYTFADPGLTLNMAEAIIMPMPGYEWAQFEEVDYEGNVVYSYYDYPAEKGNGENKPFYFWAYFAGKPGRTIIHLTDGTTISYNNQGGYRESEVPFRGSVKAKVDGIVTLANTNAAYIGVSQQEFERNVSPTVFLRLTNFTTVYFAAWLPPQGGQTEYASWAIVRRADFANANPIYINMNPTNNIGSEKLPAGKFWIEYRYPSDYGVRQNGYQPPYNKWDW